MTTRKQTSKWILTLVIIVAAVAVYFLELPSKEVKPVLTEPSVTETVLGTSSVKWYEIYFSNPKIPFDDIYTGGIENHLIEKIDKAQKTIDLAVYEFDIETVTQALIRAKNRGVTVRVVYDNDAADPDPQIKELKEAEIPAIPDERSAFMHNKFFIFDGECIWTGSFNISMNAAYRNNEDVIYFCSPEASRNYTIEFEELFSGQFGPKSPSNTPFPEFSIDGVQIENYFAPEDQVMDKIIDEVSKSKKTIHFLVFSFTDQDLAQTMINLQGNGVSVGGVFETRGADADSSTCQTLLKNGADIRLDGNPRTLHHKIIIIDEETVIFGSFNFSSNANKSNDENLLIVHDPRLAAEFEKEYQKIKSISLETVGGVCKTK